MLGTVPGMWPAFRKCQLSPLSLYFFSSKADRLFSFHSLTILKSGCRVQYLVSYNQCQHFPHVLTSRKRGCHLPPTASQTQCTEHAPGLWMTHSIYVTDKCPLISNIRVCLPVFSVDVLKEMDAIFLIIPFPHY